MRIFLTVGCENSVQEAILRDGLRAHSYRVTCSREITDPAQRWHSIRAALLVAFVGPRDRDVFLDIGFALGANRPVILVADNDVSLPALLCDVPLIRMHENAISQLLQAVQRVPASAVAVTTKRRDLHAAATDPDYLAALTPAEFERLVVDWLKSQGVQQGSEIEEGIHKQFDLVIRDGKVTTLFEVKKPSSGGVVSLDAVKQTAAIAQSYGATNAVIVAPGPFSVSAQLLAQSSNVPMRLVTAPELVGKVTLRDLMLDPHSTARPKKKKKPHGSGGA